MFNGSDMRRCCVVITKGVIKVCNFAVLCIKLAEECVSRNRG